MRPRISVRAALRGHWPEYLMEAAELGVFMLSACAFSVLLFHPQSLAVRLAPAAWGRRILMGLAMASTAGCIVYSPWGKQSGAHFNPAVTLAFWRLRRIATWDAVFYSVAQFAGGVAGVALAALVGSQWLADDAVQFAATTPGAAGPVAAWWTEFALAFVLMSVVLYASNTPRIARYTGLITAALVAISIPLAAPLSGMSMNPARSFATALPTGIWAQLWIYFTAPPLAMLLAAECFVRVRGASSVFCAKCHHDNYQRCIFCETRSAGAQTRAPECNQLAVSASNTTTTPATHMSIAVTEESSPCPLLTNSM